MLVPAAAAVGGRSIGWAVGATTKVRHQRLDAVVISEVLGPRGQCRLHL